jgi:hypothetical protein
MRLSETALKYAAAAELDLTQAEKGNCVKCKNPLVQGVNMFTPEGWEEVNISGLCEQCFDAIFPPEEEE